MSGNAARIKAIDNILNRKPVFAKTPEKLEQMWASNVFNLGKMQASLPKGVFKSIKNTIVTGEKLDPSVADAVATAMKDWATSKGALYYAHVFYPMTNLTAEKHDGFISVQGDGNVISEFSGISKLPLIKSYLYWLLRLLTTFEELITKLYDIYIYI